MYIYKSSSIPAVIISLLMLSALFLQPLLALADNSYQCVIDGDITVGVLSTRSELTVEDTLVTPITLDNSSSYNFSGVRIGVGFYSQGDDTPVYFNAYSKEFALRSHSQRNSTVNIDVSMLEKGTYDVKMVVSQGDDMELLGTLLRGVDTALTLTKTTAPVSDVEHTLTVNGQVISPDSVVAIEQGENIRAVLNTTNKSPAPIFDTPVQLAIVQGDIPLGTAVREGVVDTARLIPGGYRDTVALDMFVEGGEYSVYGFLASEDTATPIIVGKVVVGDQPGPSSWMHISKVGVSKLPLTTDSQITACVEPVGVVGGTTQLLAPAAVSFSILTGEAGDVLFTETVENEASSPKKYFTVSPGVTAPEFTLETVLRENRFQTALILSEEGGSSETEIDYVDTQRVSIFYQCKEGACEQSIQTITAPSGAEGNVTQSFWFYLAVSLAAALLMYLMLRRLHPESSGAPVDVPDEELQ